MSFPSLLPSLLDSVAPGQLRVYLYTEVKTIINYTAQHSTTLLTLLVSAHGKIRHWLQTCSNRYKVCITLEWQFLSVGAVDDNAIDGQFPCWEPKGITTSLPALIVFVVINSTWTYAVLFVYILQQCLASCLVACFFFVCLFVCCTYVYACCCNILLYVKRQWFSLSFYLSWKNCFETIYKCYCNYGKECVLHWQLSRGFFYTASTKLSLMASCQNVSLHNTLGTAFQYVRMCVLHRQLFRRFFHNASAELSLMTSCQNVSVA